jgi:hypothetical protein
MTQSKALATAFCLFAVCVFALPKATAGDGNRKTTMTFSESVEVSEAVLPTGTFTFALLDSSSDSNIVQVWNQDQIFTTISALSNYRLQPTGKTVFALPERSYDVPVAIHERLYPGSNLGLKLVIPKEREFQLATDSTFSVLAVRSYAVPNLAVITTRPTIRAKQRPAKEITLEQTYSLHFCPFLGMYIHIISRSSEDCMTWLWGAGGRPTD